MDDQSESFTDELYHAAKNYAKRHHISLERAYNSKDFQKTWNSFVRVVYGEKPYQGKGKREIRKEFGVALTKR